MEKLLSTLYDLMMTEQSLTVRLDLTFAGLDF